MKEVRYKAFAALLEGDDASKKKMLIHDKNIMVSKVIGTFLECKGTLLTQ